MTTKPELEKDNTPEKNRLRVKEKGNIEAYETVKRSLRGTPFGQPLNPDIPTDTLPYVSASDWKQNGDKSEWIILPEESVILDDIELEELEDVE